MLTLLLLAIAIILIFVVVFTILSVGGAALFIIFGDLIFAIAVIWLIIRLIRKIKRRRR